MIPGVKAAAGWRRLPRPIAEGVWTAAAGAGLYAGATLFERGLDAGPVLSAVLEETGKAGVILAAGLLALRRAARAHAAERLPARRLRGLRLDAARGLSLGLVAVALFAAAENLAYLVAFPEAGVFARLFWSLPVHLVAALIEALGADFLANRLARRWAARGVGGSPAAGRRTLVAGWSAWLLALGVAAAWHGAANRLAERGVTGATFAAGATAGLILTALLFHLFLRRSYLGGFLDAAD